MAYTAEDIADQMKTKYPRGSFDPMFNLHARLRQMLKKAKFKETEGQSIKFPAKLGLSWGVGAIADAAAFPTPVDPVRKQFEINPEVFAGSVRLGSKAKTVGRSISSSFEEGGVWEDAIEEKAKVTAKYINRIYFGANRTRLGVILTEPAANQFSLDPAYGGTALLSDQMYIDVYTAHSGGSANFTNRSITIDEDTQVATYSGADGAPLAGESVYLTGTYARTFWTLDDIIDNGSIGPTTLQGLSRDTYPRLKATVLSNGGALRNIDPHLVLQAVIAPRRKAGQQVSVILTSLGQGQKLYEHLSKDIRYPQSGAADQTFNAGFGEDAFKITLPGSSAMVIMDEDIRPRNLYAVTWDQLLHYEAMPLDWYDFGGRGIVQPTLGSDTYKFACDAYMASIEQLASPMPIAHAKVTDLADPMFGDTASA